MSAPHMRTTQYIHSDGRSLPKTGSRPIVKLTRPQYAVTIRVLPFPMHAIVSPLPIVMTAISPAEGPMPIKLTVDKRTTVGAAIGEGQDTIAVDKVVLPEPVVRHVIIRKGPSAVTDQRSPFPSLELTGVLAVVVGKDKAPAVIGNLLNDLLLLFVLLFWSHISMDVVTK